MSKRQWIEFVTCFRGYTPNELTVRIGSSFHASNGTVVKIKRTIEHESYGQSRYDYDYALIELEEPLNFTDSIQAVALPNNDVKIADETVCLVSGWGRKMKF